MFDKKDMFTSAYSAIIWGLKKTNYKQSFSYLLLATFTHLNTENSHYEKTNNFLSNFLKLL